MCMVKMVQILGNGMRPQRPITVNTAHIMTVTARNDKDGYGNPQTGSTVQMVTGWTFEIAETVDIVDEWLGVK